MPVPVADHSASLLFVRQVTNLVGETGGSDSCLSIIAILLASDFVDFEPRFQQHATASCLDPQWD